MRPYVRIPVWLIIVVGAIGTIAALVWVATLYDSHDDPILDQPLALVLVGFLGLVGTLLGLIYKRTREVKDQVSNHHVDDAGRPVLMRNEQDDRHAEILRRLDDVTSAQQDTRRDIGGVRSELRELTRVTTTNSGKIAALERRQDEGFRRIEGLEEP